ncbi:hypothetical protein SCANM63S_08053 [Streptomyces canarius]
MRPGPDPAPRLRRPGERRMVRRRRAPWARGSRWTALTWTSLGRPWLAARAAQTAAACPAAMEIGMTR